MTYLQFHEGGIAVPSHRNRSTFNPYSAPNREAFKVAHHLKQSQIEALLQRYEEGEHSTNLSEEYGIAKSTMLLLLDEHGVKKRRQPLTGLQKRQLKQLRSNGMSIRRAAERVGTSYGTAQKYLAEQ